MPLGLRGPGWAGRRLGSAAEVGFAAALGKPIVGWRSDLRLSGDDEAARVNVPVQHFVEVTGGAVLADLNSALDALTTLVMAARMGA